MKLTTLAIAFSLAITISACSGGNGKPQPHPSSPAPVSPSVFGPTHAILGRTGLVRELPDTCQAVKSMLPADMAHAFLTNSFEAPIPNFQECVWSALGNKNARVFSYEFWKYGSRDEAHKNLVDEEHANAFDEDNCRYTGSTKKISDLAEEAFSVPCTYKKYDSIRPESKHVYELGGANLVFRTRNVVIRLWWVEADYPTSETKENPHWLHGGKKLPYEQALPQAIQVAKAVLTHFPQ